MPEFKEKFGSHAKVFNGTAEMTTGRLKKGDLMKNKHGRIVSKKKHAQGKSPLSSYVKLVTEPRKDNLALLKQPHVNVVKLAI